MRTNETILSDSVNREIKKILEGVMLKLENECTELKQVNKNEERQTALVEASDMVFSLIVLTKESLETSQKENEK